MKYLLLHAPGNDCYEMLEHEEHFTLDGSNLANETLTHDAAGNLTCDGIYQYGYDAWNRMIEVTKAYRDSGGTLHSGSVTTLSRYDGANRRIEKVVQNSADLDCTYEYNYDHQSLIETRDGSSQVIQQYVWGLDYIDELIQVANNSDPTEDNTCETSYWACIDANYNVSRLIGVIGLDENSQPMYGTVERYEYTPYGQRTVFFSAGSNDPDGYAPTLISRRVTDGTTIQPYGICPVGHQGLYLDEESGIIRNRARDYKPDWGRFPQRDPTGYVDGQNLYEYERSHPVMGVDPNGLKYIVFGFDAFINGYIRRAWLYEPKSIQTQFSTDMRTFGMFNYDSAALNARLVSWGGIESCKIGNVRSTFAATYASSAGEYEIQTDTGWSHSRKWDWISGTWGPTKSGKAKASGTISVSDFTGDTTLIRITASAGYPLALIAPNIDYSVEYEFKRNDAQGNDVRVTIRGTHYRFPDYEAFSGGKLLYTYFSPSDGPDIYNLDSSTTFGPTAAPQ